jgi:hypothetical protein
VVEDWFPVPLSLSLSFIMVLISFAADDVDIISGG